MSNPNTGVTGQLVGSTIAVFYDMNRHNCSNDGGGLGAESSLERRATASFVSRASTSHSGEEIIHIVHRAAAATYGVRASSAVSAGRGGREGCNPSRRSASATAAVAVS